MYTAVLRSVCSYKFLEISLFRKKSIGLENRQGGDLIASSNLASSAGSVPLHPTFFVEVNVRQFSLNFVLISYFWR
jgi:hypothetical protein